LHIHLRLPACVHNAQVVHHFPAPRVPILSLMRENRMCDGGRLVIVTRPQTTFDYPFFEEARKVWIANQPSAKELSSDLTAAVSWLEHHTSSQEHASSSPSALLSHSSLSDISALSFTPSLGQASDVNLLASHLEQVTRTISSIFPFHSPPSSVLVIACSLARCGTHFRVSVTCGWR
jgi:hypothetical protein